ncbi:MAG: hypothetical protein ACJAXQ_001574 [Parvibaculaceae bacterium]|jgi:hypothetical protein
MRLTGDRSLDGSSYSKGSLWGPFLRPSAPRGLNAFVEALVVLA